MRTILCIGLLNIPLQRLECKAVKVGYDTDSNGVAVGSIVGMAKGKDSIFDYWQKPINDTLNTTVFGVGTAKNSQRVQVNIEHIKE